MFARNLSLRAFVGRVLRRFVEERFDQISASLAFTTLLSLVPLVAIVLGLMSLLPVFYGMVEQLDHFALRGLLPKHYAGMIIAYVLEFSQKAANVTLVGLLVLVATVFLLLQTIERAFNHVWRVTENRPWWRRLRLYAAVLVLWPLAVTCVITTISYAVTMSLGLVEEQPWLRGMLFKASGLLVATVFFAGLYFWVPNARVAARDAFRAGLFAAFGFLLMRNAFEFYLLSFPSFTLVYGAFATVPIFLVWLYLSWVIVLLGALVAATLPELWSDRRGSPEDPGQEERLPDSIE